MRIVGDVHGNMNAYLELRGFGPSIQVGDFGVGFIPDELIPSTSEHHRVIRGNHDHPQEIRKLPGFVPDGTVHGQYMFVGGAWSIDKEMRTPGRDWWPDEECSLEELYDIYDKYVMTKPDIMITHDAPQSVPESMGLCVYKQNIRTRTGEAFDAMFQAHKPKLWIFGHWHITSDMNIMGTEFICVGANDAVDINDIDFKLVRN